MITNRFYWNIKKLPNGIRPFGFFILLPPLKKLEKFLETIVSVTENNQLPPLKTQGDDLLTVSKEIDDFKETIDEEKKQKLIRKQLAKLRLSNESSDTIV
ncbi:MAG: hypothetical protein NZZ41_02620 [Candidatus Dojkabacteria bacterium]|nr:hypothetical protein [Candidatus Dojkabacteria bacterium]